MDNGLSSAMIKSASTIIGGGAAIGLAAYIGYRIATDSTAAKRLRDPALNDKIEELLASLKLSDDCLVRIMSEMLNGMEKGLSEETHHDASIKMFPTFVRDTPTGQECGSFLALDLGGTNFRVLRVDLRKEKIEMKSKIFLIPLTLMVGEGRPLFDHIARSLAAFIHSEKIEVPSGGKIPLGFTFSFPCEQLSLSSALLSTWTKGFDCPDVVGADVVKLLQESINALDVNVNVVALVNDTVGTLIACSHRERNTNIGLILGTGSNACYMEQLENVGTWTQETDKLPSQVIINMEWGAFGDKGELNFIRSSYDEEVDCASLNPGRQTYEKMISGMYMGEIVRLIILDLMEREMLFIGHMSDGYNDYRAPLYTKNAFYTKYVSEIEMDAGITFANTKRVLEEIGIRSPTFDDCAIVQYVCKIISRRAASLSAAGIVVLLNRIYMNTGKANITVGVDGSLYRFHPKFKKYMEKVIHRLKHPNVMPKLVLSQDGSGKGAALVASIANNW
ncbi:hypothetical protein SNEBB_006731 [Seison nebaliae]|nr:hypothetical protein SNEBB_006731 [Seison nebaliae]